MNLYTGYLLYMLSGVTVSIGAYVYYNGPIISTIKTYVYNFFYPQVTMVYFSKIKNDGDKSEDNEEDKKYKKDNRDKDDKEIRHKPFLARKSKKSVQASSTSGLNKTKSQSKNISFKIKELPYQCIYYDKDKRKTIQTPNINLFNFKNLIQSDNITIAFVKKCAGKNWTPCEEQYVRVKCHGHITECEKFTDLEFRSVENPFLLIELDAKGDKMSIQYDIDKFYLRDNTILDYDFLQWYMNYWYSIDLSEEYTIQIIDENIKMWSITKDHKINIDENGYKIEKI